MVSALIRFRAEIQSTVTIKEITRAMDKNIEITLKQTFNALFFVFIIYFLLIKKPAINAGFLLFYQGIFVRKDDILPCL